MGDKVTKKYTLVRGNFNERDPKSGRHVRQAHGTVHELTESQARAFADMFEPVGKGFEGVISRAPLERAPRPQPSQPQPKVVDVSDPDEPVEVDEPGTEDDAAVEVTANTANAIDTIAAMKAAPTVEGVEFIAESEQARTKPRPSVLAAADKAIDALCLIEPS